MGGGVTRLPIAAGLSTRPAVAIDLPTPPLQLDLAYPGGGIKLGLARHAGADVPIMLARHDRTPFVSCLGRGGGTAGGLARHD